MMKCATLACTEPQCPSPSSCQTKGSCAVITTGTCRQCNPGHDLVPDKQFSIGVACKPENYQMCDVCSKSVRSGCPADTSCCCGTCRKICNLMCTKHDCEEPHQPVREEVVVTLKHKITASCEDGDIDVIITNILDTIRDHLGAWPGTATHEHKCTNGAKRQSDATIETDTTLNGPDASTQADLLTSNYPATSSTNGVEVSLVSASSTDPEPQDDGLSGGAVAGIVIGSIAAAIIVLVAAFMILRKTSPESV